MGRSDKVLEPGKPRIGGLYERYQRAPVAGSTLKRRCQVLDMNADRLFQIPLQLSDPSLDDIWPWFYVIRLLN